MCSSTDFFLVRPFPTKELFSQMCFSAALFFVQRIFRPIVVLTVENFTTGKQNRPTIVCLPIYLRFLFDRKCVRPKHNLQLLAEKNSAEHFFGLFFHRKSFRQICCLLKQINASDQHFFGRCCCFWSKYFQPFFGWQCFGPRNRFGQIFVQPKISVGWTFVHQISGRRFFSLAKSFGRTCFRPNNFEKWDPSIGQTWKFDHVKPDISRNLIFMSKSA